MCALYDPILEEWADISCYFLDFRKILQNELLGSIFNRQLAPRKPLEGHGTTLEKVATEDAVAKMVQARDAANNAS